MVRVMIAKEGIEKLLDLLTAGLVEYNQSMGGWWKGGFNVGFSVTDGQTRSKTRYIPVHLTGESRTLLIALKIILENQVLFISMHNGTYFEEKKCIQEEVLFKSDTNLIFKFMVAIQFAMIDFQNQTVFHSCQHINGNYMCVISTLLAILANIYR